MSVLALHTDLDRERAVISLEGELDLASVGELDAEVDRLAGLTDVELIVLDLRGLAFMDSSGLRSVVLADARLREHAKRFALVRGAEPVQRVFEITRMAERFTFVDDPAELDPGA